jgi:hypothetical protein
MRPQPPKCGTPFEVVPVTPRPRPDKRAAVREPEVEAEEVQGAELISCHVIQYSTTNVSM